jgi:hypothetical protein
LTDLVSWAAGINKTADDHARRQGAYCFSTSVQIK